MPLFNVPHAPPEFDDVLAIPFINNVDGISPKKRSDQILDTPGLAQFVKPDDIIVQNARLSHVRLLPGQVIPATESHGLWPWMNAPAFGRLVPCIPDGGCRSTWASPEGPRDLLVGLRNALFLSRRLTHQGSKR